MGFSLLVCMSVLARNILSPRPFLSACMYLLASARMDKEKANGVQAMLVLEGQYINTSREKKAFGDRIFLADTDIHTSKEREKQMDFMPFICGEDRVGSSLVKIQLLELVMIMFGYGNWI